MASFVVREWTLAPDPRDQAPPHVHHSSDEAFYVLDGEMEFLVGAHRRPAGAGTLVFIPAGEPHTFAVPGPLPARVLVVMTPQVEALIEALHRAAGPTEVAAAWARHDSAPLG